MAQRLEVGLIKEQLRAATVRLDVIDIGRWCDAPFFKASLAVWVLKNEALSKRLPSCTVAALSSRPFQLAAPGVSALLGLRHDYRVPFLALFLVPIAVAIAAKHRTVTSRICAQGEQWHDEPQKKKPRLRSEARPFLTFLCFFRA